MAKQEMKKKSGSALAGKQSLFLLAGIIVLFTYLSFLSLLSFFIFFPFFLVISIMLSSLHLLSLWLYPAAKS